MRVQTAIDDSKFVQAISQNRQTENDLDYLVARLHGRRSRMAEAERLDNLCRIRNLHEFFRTIFPESDIKEVVGFQRQLIDQMVDEFSRFCSHLSGPGTGSARLDVGKIPGGKPEGINPSMPDKSPVRRVQGISHLSSCQIYREYPGIDKSRISCRFCPSGSNKTPPGGSGESP